MLKLAKKQIYKKSIIVFLCLLMVGNLIHWNVLCISADGHVELESAFNECCNAPDNCLTLDYNSFSSTKSDEICLHCGPCIDIPISNDLVQISKTPQKLNLKSLVTTAYVFVDTNEINSSEYHLASNTLTDTPFHTPLYTVILQV